MAYDCGIHMPKTDLLHVNINKKSYSFFAIERFDRQANYRFHVASLSGLVYASHREPSISYKDIFNVTYQLCNNHQQLDNLTNIMLFNVIMHNQDDHSKNFSYRYMENSLQSKWELSPSYDLVFCHGLGNEHMTDVSGSGNPTKKDILNLTEQFNIKNIDTKIDKIMSVAEKWKNYAERYDIPKKEYHLIQKTLEQNLQKFNLNYKNKIK